MSMSYGAPHFKIKELSSLICDIHHVKMVLKETLGLSQPYNNSGRYRNIHVCPECIWDARNVMLKLRNWQHKRRNGCYEPYNGANRNREH